MICSSDSSLSIWYHFLAGKYGAMTVASAPDWRNFWTESGRSVQGGLHHFVSAIQRLSGRWRQSTASELGFRQRGL
jgi:hypothetical protein